MRLRISTILLIVFLVLAGGCSAGRASQATGDGFPPQIGEPRAVDLSELDAYEQAVVQIVQHIEDGVQVLAAVQDLDSSKHAAGMFLEASGRVVDLRQRMLKENPGDRLPPYILLAYGPRYFFARLETERQLKRIKALDNDIHLPLKSVLTRLDDEIKRIEKEHEQARNGEAQDSS